MSNNHAMGINKQYASWLNTYKWNYFITLRSNYKYNYMTVRTWMKSLFNKQTSVTRVFYATERDKGDWTSNHTHVLISSKKTITYSELKKTFSYDLYKDILYLKNKLLIYKKILILNKSK